MKNFKTLNELLSEVNTGKTVYWASGQYKVKKEGFQFYIQASTGMRIGLLTEEGSLNGKLEDFFSI